MEPNFDSIEYDPNDPGNQPKNELLYPEIFTKARKILGNIIVKRMKTSGGSDLDWIIEHNGHFMIWEIRTFNDDYVHITKAQMNMLQTMCNQLNKCDFFFIAHEDIDFKDPKSLVWFFDMKKWEKSLKNECEKLFTNSSKYIFHKSMLTKTNVKILRDIIDASWDIN